MTESTMRKSDRFIPWMIVVFFVVVAMFDGIFVYLATSTHTGVVTKHAYKEGLAYNETVAEAEAQAALHWDGKITFDDPARKLGFSLLDAEGSAIEGATVRAEVKRPTQDGMDFTVSLAAEGAGNYGAVVEFPRQGVWDVRIFVEWKQEQYQLSQRVIVAN